MRIRCRKFLGSTATKVVTVGMVIAGAMAPAASGQRLDVVADGLKNPRGMSFGPGGALYVAEAGRGGSGPCIPAPTPGPPTCYGATGAITRINVKSGVKRRIVKRLPSLARQEGGVTEAIGPQDISFAGRTGYFTLGLGANPAARAQLGPAGVRFATVYRLARNGRISRFADIGTHEAQHDPDAGQPGAVIDTNPYSIDATRPSKILVTDAGGNDLLEGRPRRRRDDTRGLPIRPDAGAAVPGAPAGHADPLSARADGRRPRPRRSRVRRAAHRFSVPRRSGNAEWGTGNLQPRVVATGATTVIDVATGPNNSIYVLQMSSQGLAGPPSPGKLIRIARSGAQSELAAGRLKQPTGLALPPRGDVYVANDGMSPDDGQIVRIR